MLDKAKMMAKAYKLRLAIQSQTFEVEENNIKVLIGGDFEVKSIAVNGEDNKDLSEIINKAIKKVQENSAIKMKEMMELEDITE